VPVTSHTDGATLTATGLSKVLSDMQSPLLFFGCSDSPWKIAASGVPVDNHPYGNQVQQRYAELAALLAAKYGAGQETDNRDTTLYKAPNKYVASIENGEPSGIRSIEHPRSQLSCRSGLPEEALTIRSFTRSVLARWILG
jgi:hypothetical protein